MALARGMQTRRTELLAHFDEQFRVEAEASAGVEYPAKRGEVDRVLALVVRGAAAVPAAVDGGHGPRRTAIAPLLVVTGNDVAVAVDQHRRPPGILHALGEQHRRCAGDRIA